MGLLKRIRKIHSRVVHAVARQARKDVKRTVRVLNKTAPYVTGVLAGAASYFGGPVAGAAVGAIGSQISFSIRKEYGREKGESHKTRTQKARSVRRRAAVAAGVGLGLGAVASGITTAALGGTFSQSIASAGLGQGGGQLLGTGAPGVFSGSQSSLSGIVTAGNFGAQAASPVSGIVTSLPGGAASVAPASAIGGAAAAGGPSLLQTLAVTTLGAAATRALQTGQVSGGTGAQGGNFDAFARGAEAALGMAGLSGGGVDGAGAAGGGNGFPNVQDGQGGTDWMKLLLIAGAVYAGAKILKVA